MSTPAKRRLVRDWTKLSESNPQGFNAQPLEDNILVWEAVIFGPQQTYWEGGVFKLVMEFSEEYPSKPPNVRFKSRIYHPNVYQDGNICLDILQNQWSPIYDVWAILTSIRSLLNDPNPVSPANHEAAKLYEDDQKLYSFKVMECVENSWIDHS